MYPDRLIVVVQDCEEPYDAENTDGGCEGGTEDVVVCVLGVLELAQLCRRPLGKLTLGPPRKLGSAKVTLEVKRKRDTPSNVREVVGGPARKRSTVSGQETQSWQRNAYLRAP